MSTNRAIADGGIAVIWIDWYAYHIARFRALAQHPKLAGRVHGIELVGGTGVHAGLVFRDGGRDGLAIDTLAPNESWRQAGQFRLARLLWRALNRLQPAAVLIPGYYTLPGLAAAFWCRVKGRLPILMTESAEQDHRRSPMKEAVKRAGLHLLFDRAVCGGKAHLRYLQKLGMPVDRIGFFYDSVDNEFYRRSSQQLRAASSARAEALPEHYFLFVGRLAPEKNLMTLLEAFAGYLANGGVWHLVLAGDGPLATTLREHSEALGIAEKVHFLGMRNTAGLSAPYAFASCFVLPSSREPWGLVVNEAMASGLPVLVSRQCGCAPDLVADGVNGWTFDSSDVPGLTSLLLRVATLDPKVLAEVGARSSETITRHSPDAWAGEVVRLAGRVAEQSTPGKMLETVGAQ